MLRLSLLEASVVEAALAPLLLLLLLAEALVLPGPFGVVGAELLEAACPADVLLDVPLLLAPFLTPSLHQQHCPLNGHRAFWDHTRRLYTQEIYSKTIRPATYAPHGSVRAGCDFIGQIDGTDHQHHAL